MILLPMIMWSLLWGRLEVYNVYYFIWAVICSCLIGAMAFALGQLAKSSQVFGIEVIVMASTIVMLYLFSFRWNLFFLFPFFTVGYFLRNLRFHLGNRGFGLILILFVIGLCFWNPSYSPWKVGALAWKDDASAIAIYLYRFVLALCGVWIMSKLFVWIRSLLHNNKGVRSFVEMSGEDSLLIYILQGFLVEYVARNLSRLIYNLLGVTELSRNYQINLIGYLFAPFCTVAVVLFILKVIQAIKRSKVLCYSLCGFRIFH